jgi:hypothetical protein
LNNVYGKCTWVSSFYILLSYEKAQVRIKRDFNVS